MADSKDKEPSASSSQAPPPMDPFPTYQTPYPRSRNDEENPFIQFRRFADEQFNSLFHGIPQFLGFTSSASFKNDMAEMMRRRHEMEEGWRKQFEQDIEEMKQASQKDHVQASDVNVPWWQRGKAASCPGLNELGTSSNARKCPEMYDDAGSPKTELDMYEGLTKHPTQSNIDAEQSQAKTEVPRKSKGWLKGIGWDGQRLIERSQIDESDPISVESWDPNRPTRYTRFQTRRMDPVEDSQETIPWLMLSPYSPIYLSNPYQPRLFKVHLQENEGIPFKILRPRFQAVRNPSDLEEKMVKLPWADAFEDLVSLQQTGKMVDREVSTYRTPNTWIHDMVHRGSLGPRWGFNDEGMLTRQAHKVVSQPEPQNLQTTAVSDSTTDDQASQQDSEFNWNDINKIPEEISKSLLAAVKEAEKASPVIGMLIRKIERSPEAIFAAIDAQVSDGKEAVEQAIASAREAAEIHSEKVIVNPAESFASAKVQEAQTPSFSPSSDTASSWSSRFDSSNNKPNSIISTMTRTESRTLPDGSRETRRVLRRKFADGREDNEESVDIQPASTTASKQVPFFFRDETANTSDKNTQTASQAPDQAKQHERKSGWFWT